VRLAVAGSASPQIRKNFKNAAAGISGSKRISIDYALMEHAHNVVVADGAFEWDDFGSGPPWAGT
jgi:mannose-1-phosphate guanylyltransferase